MVIEIILFGKMPCIAIRIEEKKMHFITQILTRNKQTIPNMALIYSTYTFTVFKYFCQI